MNNESPLVPQGSFLDQKNKGRARVKIAVFIVLAIHGVGVMALLMQGCQKAPDTSVSSSTNSTSLVDTNPAPIAPPLDQTNLPTVADQGAGSNGATTVTTQQAPVPPENTSVTQPASVTSHKIARGDTFDKLARQYKVSAKAIQEANPGVDPTKLKIDTVIQIPAPSVASVPSSSGTVGAATGAAEPAANGNTYKVKSGDTLIKIAGQFGVSVKALRSANGLKTDRIRVGQTLKIPAKNGGTAAGDTTAPKPQ